MQNTETQVLKNLLYFDWKLYKIISCAVYGMKGRKCLFMKIWFKIWKDNHMLRDTVITKENNDTRTHKIFQALDEVCYQFDLGKPMWLDATIAEFKRHSRARFTQDNFVEQVDFDYLEIQVLEED